MLTKEHLAKMSEGLGRIERWLLWIIGTAPMSFDEILARTYPPGSFATVAALRRLGQRQLAL